MGRYAFAVVWAGPIVVTAFGRASDAGRSRTTAGCAPSIAGNVPDGPITIIRADSISRNRRICAGYSVRNAMVGTRS